MFDVFVEGPVDPSPAGLQRLAETMASKYGLTSADLATRLARGRMRVKANVDRATAEAYVRDLGRIGARCTIEGARPSTATPPVGVQLATPPVGVPVVKARPPRVSTPAVGIPIITPEPRRPTPSSAAPEPPRRPTPSSSTERAARPGSTETPFATTRAGTTPPRRQATTPPAGAQSPSRATPPAGTARPATPAGGTGRAPPSPSTAPSPGRTPPLGTPRPAMPARQPAPVDPNVGVGRAQTIASSEMVSPRPPAPLVAATFRTPTGGIPVTKTPPSGLAAALSPVETDLGALETGALSLSSLDGVDAPASSASFDPPDLDTGPAGSEPPRMPVAAPKGERPKDEPLDLFAAPDAGPAIAVDLAPDELEFQARKRASTPIPAVADVPPPQRKSAPSIAAPATSMTRARSKLGPLADAKIRLAAGVVAAILVGFLPATIIASIRERGAFKDIDGDYVSAVAGDAGTPDDFDEIYLDKKKSARRDIALTSMLVWAVAGGAIAYVWFRRVPWDRWT